jgi:hypothetical protein
LKLSLSRKYCKLSKNVRVISSYNLVTCEIMFFCFVLATYAVIRVLDLFLKTIYL